MHLAIKKIISSSPAIKEMVGVLPNSITLSYFQYDKRYSDNRRAILTSKPDWFLHCIENAYYKISYFESEISSRCSKIILWQNINQISAPVFLIAKTHFNMDNGISIINHLDTFTEYYHFAFSCNNTQINTTSSDLIEVLKKFTLFFKDKAHSLIAQVNKSLYIYPDGNAFDKLLTSHSAPNQAADFSLPLKRYYLSDKNGQYLTKTEFSCLKALFTNDNLSSTAKILGINENTIYKHVENIKLKLNCRTLFQVGELLFKSPMAHLFVK